MASDTKLSSQHTVRDYEIMKAGENREGIADLIQRRLLERYVWTIEGVPDPDRSDVEEERIRKQKNGFTSMAVACLLIETLQSFVEGLPSTNKKSEAMFQHFFEGNTVFSGLERTKSTPTRTDPNHRSNIFYKDVRCAILHLGETKGGWKITRRGEHPLFDKKTRRVNATKFLQAVGDAVRQYCEGLRSEDWHSQQWKNCITKMDAIVSNCRAVTEVENG